MAQHKLWYAWFILIAVLVYSPIAAPYNTVKPFILDLPFTLFTWIALTLILLLSIILFALESPWEEKS
jgi:hypothetical protein